MTKRNHPNPEMLYPALSRREVELLAACEKEWISRYWTDDAGRELFDRWTENGLVETRLINLIYDEYRTTRAGKFVVRGWREAGWIE